MNGTDPLAQLRDIHLPPPIGWWPPAPGWWLLAALVSIALLAIVVWAGRRYRQRRYRRFALRQLRALHQQWQTQHDDAQFVQAVNRLLKQCALSAFPHSEVAILSGAEWLEFLDRRLRKPRFTEPNLRALANIYRPAPPEIPAEALFAAAEYWIRRHQC
jgi:hypothetical protein